MVTSSRAPTRIVRGETGGATWELAVREVGPQLRPYVRSLMGYDERAAHLVRRRELPSPQVVVILELGQSIRVFDGDVAHTYPGGFVAGVDERPTICEHDGHQRGVQLDLTPIGARLFFGLPMSELAGRVVSLDDVLPRARRRLAEHLEGLPGWDARLDVLERLLEEQLAELRGPTKLVAWAVRRIEERGGAIDARALARELGYSQKHVIALFRDHVGVPPKQLARLVRFECLVQRLRAGAARGEKPRWAELALDLGFADQSHMWRDVKGFAGITPTQIVPEIAEMAALLQR